MKSMPEEYEAWKALGYRNETALPPEIDKELARAFASGVIVGLRASFLATNELSAAACASAKELP